MSITTSSIRMDKKTKEAADKQLKKIGLNFNSYVNLAVTQLLIQRQVPFEIKLPENSPREKTRKAIESAEKKIQGILPEDTPVFSDGKSLVEFMKNYKDQ